MSLASSLKRLASSLLPLAPDPEACLEGEAIRMYWWNDTPNLGDTIGPALVAHLSGRPVVHREKRQRCKLLSCGSIVSKARAGDIIWGTGSLDTSARLRSRRVTVAAVRGPLTRKLLLAQGVDCPEVYGDPGCIAPILYPKAAACPELELGVIPHYTEKSLFDADDPSVTLLDIQSPPEVFFPLLARCRRVVSTSLHGVIFAEAYGIPASWMELSGKVRGGGHKFADYYLGTGREPPAPLGRGELKREPDWTPPKAENAGALLASFPFPRAREG